MMRMERPLSLALAIAASLAVGGTSAMAGSNTCSRVGTWFGAGDTGFQWLAVDSPGASATAGQITLEFSLIEPTFGGYFPTAVRVTTALGVWEKLNHRKYRYTWIACGIDAGGNQVYVGRATGMAVLADCDHVNLTYTAEFFDPAQDISTEEPAYGAFPGTAEETRMRVAVK